MCLQRIGEEKEHVFMLNNWVCKSDVADGWKEIPVQREDQRGEEKEDEDKEENEKKTEKEDTKENKGNLDEHNEDNKEIEKKPEEEKSSPAPALPGNQSI